MSKRRRKISGGRYAAEYVFSRSTRYDCPKARAEKRNHTSQVQQALNDKNALIYNTCVIAATFLSDETSQFFTLTVDDAHYPFDAPHREQWPLLRKQLENFIARAQRLSKRRNKTFFYGWSQGVGELGRYHIHMVAKGLSREDITTIWGLGNVDSHYLAGDVEFLASRDWMCPTAQEVNPERIAQYMINNAKPLRKVGGRLIHFSRNCTRPTVEESAPVSDGYRLEAPEGSAIIDQRTENTMYSSFAFVSYIMPSTPPKRIKHRQSKLRGRTP